MTLFQDRPHIRTETKPLDIFPITKGFQFRLGNGILISRQTATEPEFHLSFEILTQFFRRFNQFQDAFLLIFILMSVFMTNFLDLLLVRLTHLGSNQKAAVRLLSSIYIVMILLYIRFIYDDTNYDTLILYFITLAAGRFVYFDFTPQEFSHQVRGIIRNLPMLALIVCYSGIVCWYGFHVDFLLKSNGVIVSTLIAHLFMDLSIFILHKTRLLNFFL